MVCSKVTQTGWWSGATARQEDKEAKDRVELQMPRLRKELEIIEVFRRKSPYNDKQEECLD